MVFMNYTLSLRHRLQASEYLAYNVVILNISKKIKKNLPKINENQIIIFNFMSVM